MLSAKVWLLDNADLELDGHHSNIHPAIATGFGTMRVIPAPVVSIAVKMGFARHRERPSGDQVGALALVGADPPQ